MKVYLDQDEAWPVYSVTTEEKATEYDRRNQLTVELTEAEMEQIATANQLWRAAQDMLDDKYEVARDEHLKAKGKR